MLIERRRYSLRRFKDIAFLRSAQLILFQYNFILGLSQRHYRELLVVEVLPVGHASRVFLNVNLFTRIPIVDFDLA